MEDRGRDVPPPKHPLLPIPNWDYQYASSREFKEGKKSAIPIDFDYRYIK